MLDEVPMRPVRSSTLSLREHQIRAFASALVHRGRDPTTIRLLRDLIEIEAFKEGLRYFLDRNGNRRTAGIKGVTDALIAIARHYVRVEPGHLARLTAILRRLAPDHIGPAEVNRNRLRQFDDPSNVLALLRLPRHLMHLATRNPNPIRGAVQAQLAVAIEILLMAPMRLGNLARLDLDRNLVRPGRNDDLLHLVIEPDEVKNREPLEYPLPAPSVRLLDRYLGDFRSRLAPASNSALFPGRGGRSKNKDALGLQISQVIREHTGLHVNPHLFRHIPGKLYLEQNPGAYEVVRRVLAHRSLNTTKAYYTGLETAAAVRHFDETILKLRSQ